MSVYRLFNRSYRDYVADKEVLRTLNIIILSIAIGTILFSMNGGAVFAGFASAIGAGEFAFGLISALPVLASLLQLLTSYLIEKTGRLKRLFLVGGLTQRVIWFVIAFIPYIFPEYIAQWRLAALISLVMLAGIASSFVGVPHMFLMAGSVPMGIRGRYLTTRQRVTTVVSLLTGLGVAYILDHLPGFLGYTIVLSIGGLAGIADILLYTTVTFPAVPRSDSRFSVIGGMKTCFKTPKTRDYLIFYAFWSFAINLSSAFFNKYAIDVLSLSFTQMIIFGQITANILSMLIVSRWGVFIDRYGCVPLLLISGSLSTLGVLVWLPASPGSVVPMFLFNVLGGMFWCANDTCSVNMQLTHTPEIGRSITLAVYAVVTSVSAAAALVTGGALLEAATPLMSSLKLTVFGTPFDHYKLLFCITIVLRLLVLVIFLPRVWNEKGISLREAYMAAFSDARSRIAYVTGRLRMLRRGK